MPGNAIYNAGFGFWFVLFNACAILSSPNVFLKEIERKTCGAIIDEEIINQGEKLNIVNKIFTLMGEEGFIICSVFLGLLVIFNSIYGGDLDYFNVFYAICAYTGFFVSSIICIYYSVKKNKIEYVDMGLPSCRDDPNTNCPVITDDNVDEQCTQIKKCNKSCSDYYRSKGNSPAANNMCAPEIEGFSEEPYDTQEQKKYLRTKWDGWNALIGIGMQFVSISSLMKFFDIITTPQTVGLILIGVIFIAIGSSILKPQLKGGKKGYDYELHNYKPGIIATCHFFLGIISIIIVLSIYFTTDLYRYKYFNFKDLRN